MNDEARKIIIEKIKKCLALAKSSNEHEAAAGLRQAQKLMQAHGITDLDIEHADIQEEGATAGAARKPASWECGLADRVAKAFGCDVYLSVGMLATRWMFVGAAPSAEIARYAFEVLFRQVKRARANHIKTALKRCTTTRTRRADLFCEGWVITATALIERFSGNEEMQARIAGYLENKHNLKSFHGTNRNAGRNLSERDYGDLDAGCRAGKAAQLNRGVAGAASPLALE
jgi:hypothetical protein